MIAVTPPVVAVRPPVSDSVTLNVSSASISLSAKTGIGTTLRVSPGANSTEFSTAGDRAGGGRRCSEQRGARVGVRK
jgi:hypothetical protein